MWKDLLAALFNEDNLYIQALNQSYEMLAMDLTMFEASIESLRHSDSAEILIDVYKLDEQINAYERDVRKKVMTHLTVTGSRDLAPGLVLTSVVVDIERIGDYTKNICDLAQNHPTRLHAGDLEERVKKIEINASDLFKDMISAFKNSDEDEARRIMEGYKEDVSRQSDEIAMQIVRGEAGGMSAGDATAVALYVRYLKRIAAHSRNIITSVVNPFDRLGYKYAGGENG